MEAKANVAFSISLDSNPTTGYSWQAAFDDSFLKLVDHSFDPDPSGAIGAGGKERFTFLPIRAGETTIRMSYRRPWESGSADERSFAVLIRE